MSRGEDTTAEFKAVQATLKTLEESMKKTERLQPLRLAWRTFLWFALPFGAMWGFGVDPITAARAAVAPAAIVLIMFMIAGAFGIMASGLARSWLDTDAQIADLKVRLRQAQTPESDQSS